MLWILQKSVASPNPAEIGFKVNSVSEDVVRLNREHLGTWKSKPLRQPGALGEFCAQILS